MSNEQQSGDPPPMIELEPPHGSPHGEGKARFKAGSQDDEIPIPEKPAHACPHCDYNLTGLTTRRCPECGEEFLLYEARWHAAEIGEGGEELLKLYRRDRILYIVGGACGLVGFLTPLIAQIITSLWSTTPTSWLAPPPCHLIPAIGMLLLLKMYFEWRWSSLVCIGGIYMLLGGLAALI